MCHSASESSNLMVLPEYALMLLKYILEATKYEHLDPKSRHAAVIPTASTLERFQCSLYVTTSFPARC